MSPTTSIDRVPTEAGGLRTLVATKLPSEGGSPQSSVQEIIDTENSNIDPMVPVRHIKPRIPRPRQLQLFPRSKPLSARFGHQFFIGIPRAPGVYFMYDAADKILYIGQSSDLRDRLNSYRHIHPDRDARRTWRLVHLVRRIEWRVTTTAEEAIALERELLLKHRPRFNRASVWPSPNWFINLTVDNSILTLRIFRESTGPEETPSHPNQNLNLSAEYSEMPVSIPTLTFNDCSAPLSAIPNGRAALQFSPENAPPDKTLCPQITQITQIKKNAGDENSFPYLRESASSAGTIPPPLVTIAPDRFGPFNSGLRYLFPTLLRLLFFSLMKPAQFSDFPLNLLKNRNLDHCEFSLSSGDESLIGKVTRYLALESDDFVRHLETEIQAASPVKSPFEKTYWAAELERLRDFFDARAATLRQSIDRMEKRKAKAF